MSEGLTKEHFDKVVGSINQRFDGMEARMTVSTKDIIRHFNQSQGYQNEKLEVMDVKLDALM